MAVEYAETATVWVLPELRRESVLVDVVPEERPSVWTACSYRSTSLLVAGERNGEGGKLLYVGGGARGDPGVWPE